MATIPNAMLLCASSPYARRGSLWDSYRKHFGKDDDVLIWQAETRLMNPTVPQRTIDDALERDPAKASADYLAQFRSDLEAFVSRDVVMACVTDQLFERAPEPNVRYFGFTDPSGGSSDAFTLAVAHRDGDSLFLDCVREVRPPFSPDAVVSEFAQTCKQYRITKLVGDKFAGAWPVESFRKYGITYEQSAKPKSDLYRDFLPLLNSKRVDLLDHPKLINQLCALERRVGASGRDRIDHPEGHGHHDDVCNAVAGALVYALQQQRKRLRVFAAPLPYAAPKDWDRVVEFDPATGERIEPEQISALDPRKNGCIPGPGIDSDTTLELLAIQFNNKRGIRRP